ncbi:MAG: ATP-binding protein [Bacteroidetes bacterium]|nr:ATP-binding protein [Bacteroidota bacterium]
MRLVLPSTPEAVPEAVRFAEAAASEAAFPDEVGDRMSLAVGEAVANAVEHGNDADANRIVKLEWRKKDSGGWLSVEDEGPGLTLDLLQNATLPDNALQAGGRGLFIIKELTDDVRLEAEGRRLMLWFAPRPGETA